MKVIVTGGSGFIGTNVIQHLESEGYDIRSLDIVMPKLKEHETYFKRVDVADRNALQDAIIEFNPDYIIHLAAQTGMESIDPNAFHTNIESAKNLCSISGNVSNLKKIVFTSSLLVCRNGYLPSSDIDFCPPNGYGHSKALSEIIARENMTGAKWDIVRPTSIWGPWFEGGYKLFFNLVRRGLFLNPGSAPIMKPTCYVGNAAFMIEKIMKSQSSSGVYYLADYPQSSVQDWANLIYKASGSTKELRSAPAFLLNLIARVGDVLRLIGIPAPLYTARLKNMTVSKEYPIQNTKALVGDLPFTRKVGVERTIEWLASVE